MTKQKSILVLMIVSLVFNVAFLGGLLYRLHERSRLPKPPFPPGLKKERFSRERTDMPEGLREKMHDIHKQFSPRMRELQGRIREERDALIEILMADEPDSTAVENQLKRIGECQLEIEREVVHRLFREKDLLPLEQRRQFLEMVTRRYGGPSRSPGEGRMRHRFEDKKEKE